MTRNGTDVPHICFPALAEELRRRRRGRATIFAVYVSPKNQRKRSLIPQPLEKNSADGQAVYTIYICLSRQAAFAARGGRPDA